MRPCWQHPTYIIVSIPHMSYCQDQLGFDREMFIYICVCLQLNICSEIFTKANVVKEKLSNSPCSLTKNILRRACLFTFHITQYLRLLHALLLFDKHYQVIIIFLIDSVL